MGHLRISKSLLALFISISFFVLPNSRAENLAPSNEKDPTQKEVSICADPDPPPWTYWERDAENKPIKTKFIGFSVDILTAAFAKMNVSVKFIGNLPWARCLEMVKIKQVDFAMDGYFDSERAKVFDYSDHYNTLTPQVFFNAKAPIKIKGIADLKKHQGCGMIGASYAHYDLLPSDLDTGVNTYAALIEKLKYKRCEYFVEELEVITGYKYVGVDHLKGNSIKRSPVPDAKAPSKYIFSAKNSEASKLIPQFNQALAGLIKSGEAKKFWNKHAPDLKYNP